MNFSAINAHKKGESNKTLISILFKTTRNRLSLVSIHTEP